jgi:hypothetical protein
VYAGLEINVETERDSETGSHDSVTGCCGDSKVLGFGCPSRHIDWSPELPGQNIGSRDAVLVVIFEVLGQDPALRIDDVHTWIRNSIGRCAWLRFFIEDVIGAYDLRVRIREQRIGDMLPIREALEGADGIITNGRYTESLLSDRDQTLFQLDELDLAERSPVGGAEEHEHGPFWTHDGFESLIPAVLIPRGKRGYLLAHVWPGLDVLAV